MRIRFALRNNAQLLGFTLAFAAPLVASAQDASPPAPEETIEQIDAAPEAASPEVAVDGDDAEADASQRPMLDMVFRRWDVSQDGSVERFEAPSERRTAFDRLLGEADANGDEMLQHDEFAEGVDHFANEIFGHLRFAALFQPDGPPRDDQPADDRPRDGDARGEGRREGARRADGRPAEAREGRPPRDGEGRGGPGRRGGQEGRRGPDGPRGAGGFGGGPRGGEGRGGMPGFGGPPLFGALDRDGNGRISNDEIQTATRSLRRLDRNRDGELTRDEIAPGFGRNARPASDRREGRPGGFEGRGRDRGDRDGRDEERRGPGGPGGPREGRGPGEAGEPGVPRGSGQPGAFGPGFGGPGRARGPGGPFGGGGPGGFGPGGFGPGGFGGRAGGRGDGGPTQGPGAGPNAERLFERLDRNSDGNIDQEELRAVLPLLRRPAGGPPARPSGGDDSRPTPPAGE